MRSTSLSVTASPVENGVNVSRPYQVFGSIAPFHRSGRRRNSLARRGASLTNRGKILGNGTLQQRALNRSPTCMIPATHSGERAFPACWWSRVLPARERALYATPIFYRVVF